VLRSRSVAPFRTSDTRTLDATLVARFEAAGLIPLGKTNVPEFGLEPLTKPKLYGPARKVAVSGLRKAAS
jgi:Asp-tRNA(Asn)/Glu-tRNA(Gln) amidotransferase A subunit family amidase